MLKDRVARMLGIALATVVAAASVVGLASPARATAYSLWVSKADVAIGDTIQTGYVTSQGLEPGSFTMTGPTAYDSPGIQQLSCDSARCDTRFVHGFVASEFAPGADVHTIQTCPDTTAMHFGGFDQGEDHIPAIAATLTNNCRTLSGHLYDEDGEGVNGGYVWIERQVPFDYLIRNESFIPPLFIPNGRSAWAPGLRTPLTWGYIAKTDAGGAWSAIVANQVDGSSFLTDPDPQKYSSCNDPYFGYHAPADCLDYLGYAVAPLSAIATGHSRPPYAPMRFDRNGTLINIDDVITSQAGTREYEPYFRDSISVEAGNVNNLDFTQLAPGELAINSVTADVPNPHPGDEISYRVRYSNPSTRTINNVGLSMSAGGSPIVSGIYGTGVAPRSLAPGEATTDTFTITVGQEGSTTLIFTVNGATEGRGRPVSATRSEPLEVVESNLGVVLTSNPEAPEIDEDYVITAAITNTSGGVLTDVHVINPLGVAAGTTGVTVGQPTPGNISTLAAGDTASITWDVHGGFGRLKFSTVVGGTNSSDQTVSKQVRLILDVGKAKLEWEIAPRFEGQRDVVVTYKGAHPTSYKYKAIIKKSNDAACDATLVPKLFIAGDPVAYTATSDPCQLEFTRPDIEKFTLDLDLYRGAEKAADATTDIEAKDFLIASLGDSLSSGEGVPDFDTGSEPWTAAQCHRSIKAGSAQGALNIEREDKHSSVTFVHLACSGATTPVGMTGEYAGVTPNGFTSEAPQVNNLRRIAGDRTVDALVMTMGINDVQFAGFIQDCVIDCNTQTVIDRYTGLVQMLPDRYGELSSALSVAGVQANNVFILEYPDATRDDNGDFCAANLASEGFINQAEWEVGYSVLMNPLNQAVAAGAATHSWNFVGGVADAFRNHGICANSTWFTGIPDSIANQGDHKGSFHPNYIGHEVYGEFVRSALHAHLGIGNVGGQPPEADSAPASMSADVNRGATSIATKHNRFNVGSFIRINPGARNQETRVVTGVASGSASRTNSGVRGARATLAANTDDTATVSFGEPLMYDHDAGEVIVLQSEVPLGTTSNRGPIAVPDTLYTLCNSSSSIAAWDNDFDPDGDAIRLDSVQSSVASIVETTPLPGYRYVSYPATGPGFIGETITYLVRDPSGATASGTINVLPTPGDSCGGSVSDVTITSGPSEGSFTKASSGRFKFSSNASGVTFECNVDGGAWKSCKPTGYSVSKLTNGMHTMQVRSKRAGVVNQAAVRNWTVDRVKPSAVVETPTFAPAYARNAVVVPSYFCHDNNGVIASCVGPATVDTSRKGKHSFVVKVVDAAGNKASVKVTYSVL